MAGGKKRGLTREGWAEVRKLWESGVSEAELAVRYGVDRKTIRAHKRDEAWTPHVTPHVGKTEAKAAQERATAKVIDLASRRAIEQLEQTGVVEDASRIIAEELVIAGRVRLQFAKALEKFANDLSEGTIQPSSMPATRDMAQFMKDALSAYHVFTSTLREDLGRLKGAPTVPETDEKRPAVTKFVIVEREETA